MFTDDVQCLRISSPIVLDDFHQLRWALRRIVYFVRTRSMGGKKWRVDSLTQAEMVDGREE